MSSLAASEVSSTQTGLPRVSLLQFHVTEDKSINLKTARRNIEEAARGRKGERKPELLVLPEVWNSPYATEAFPEYAEVLPSVEEGGDMRGSESAEMLSGAAKEFGVFIVGGSVPERDGDDIYNTCMVFDPRGVLVAKHRKVHLFDIDVPGGITFKESDTLTAGGGLLTTFDTGEGLFGMVGVGICYDIRFPELALLLTKEKDVSMICFPGAFNMTTGPAHWELLQRARAVDSQAFVLTASPARATEEMLEATKKDGKFPPYTAWGHSTAVNPWGEIIGSCDEGEAIVEVEIDVSKSMQMKTNIPTALQKRTDLYSVEFKG
ncbi:hypothetical protein TrVE_jg3558 [Triparma verrucosa]|uniref:CN hydrolase domain-containing protein n=1 Tax=Triparma verrucosa TaxID=1606542 RepID=A0A9W7F4X2_9STRA|nr:hypothetical protein TrVE_jg3558 [Triparma verrucosa]